MTTETQLKKKTMLNQYLEPITHKNVCLNST